MADSDEAHNIFKEIFLIFLSSFAILFAYPILFITLLTCWLNKKLAVKLAQKDPKVCHILEGINGILAGQDPYTDPLVVIVPYMYLANNLDIHTVVKFLKEKVIEPKLYPQLTQRIVRRYGYHFWYSVDDFKVENHVHYLKPECPNMAVTRTELRDAVSNSSENVSFDPSKSPWEVLVVPTMIDDRDPEVKSVFILRVNHCLMDGFSVINFMEKVALEPWKMRSGDKLGEKPKKTNKIIQIYKFLMLLFLGPYHFFKMFTFSNDTHKFVRNTFKSDFEEIYNSQCTPEIPDSRLKSVKNDYGVSMSSLIVTLLSHAIGKYMKRGGSPMPSTIHGLLSFPLPGHDDVLTNHWSLVRIPIKVNESHPGKTLKFVENEFQSLRNSVKPLVFFYANKMMALVPLCLRPNTKSLTPTTFVLTNFPGPAKVVDIFGCIVKNFSLGGKTTRGACKISKKLNLYLIKIY